MITIEQSYPKKSNQALLAQDIIWTQFNDINFYVEDIDQENFYLQVLKNLFPKIKINRIFPLGGKENVIKEARKSISNKKKIFIVDLDFDEILKKKQILRNLFYLKKYSIENYLLEKDAIYELIREESPKISLTEIKSRFNLQGFHLDCVNLFKVISSNFLVIKKFELGINYLKIEPQRDCELNNGNCCIKEAATTTFFKQVEVALMQKKPKMKYSTQVTNHIKYFNTIIKCLKNVPGKYLINFLCLRLKKIFNFSQSRIETFTYRLAKNCNFKELKYLKLAIAKNLS